MILIFDLDKTLYSSDNELFKEVDKRINLYLIKYLNIPEKEVNKVRYEYWLKYGTTLNGLMKFYKIDPIHYLEFVHDVNLEKYLNEDIELQNILKGIPFKKYVFTNGYLPFATKVLSLLGIEKYFNDIFDIIWIDYIPKPYFYGYQKIIKKMRINPLNSIFFDDFYLNLFPAKYLRMTTVLVKKSNIFCDYIDYKIPEIKKLKNFKFIIDI